MEARCSLVLPAAELGDDLGLCKRLAVTGEEIGFRLPVDEVLHLDIEAARIIERAEPELKSADTAPAQ